MAVLFEDRQDPQTDVVFSGTWKDGSHKRSKKNIEI